MQSQNRRESRAKNWWKFAEPAPNLRRAIQSLEEVLVIPCVSPHLIVSRQKADTCFDHQLMVVAFSSAYHLGILQSRLHDAWAWARGSTLKGDLRYTNTTIFETFPFPLLPDGRYEPRRVPDTKNAEHVTAAAANVESLRAQTCQERRLGLTKVHNLLKAGELPELSRAYEVMNDAVTALYGFPEGAWRDDRETLRRLFMLNQQVATPLDGAVPESEET